MTAGEWARRMIFWRRRARLERELQEELDEHRALLTRDLIAQGLSSAEAAHQAAIRLGSRTRIVESSRDTWGFIPVESLLQDIRHAARTLRRTPGITLAVFVTLALGVGATTAIFSVVRGVLLRPLPLANEDRVIALCEQYPGSTPNWCGLSPPNLADVLVRSHTIQAAGIGRGWSSHLATPEGARPVRSGIATPGFFAALGARMARGRMIVDGDLLGRQSDVAIISWQMWQDRFGGDSGIVGRMLSLDGHAVSVVGVLAQGFAAPEWETIELWRPLHVDLHNEKYRDWRGFMGVALLKPGVSLAAARADIANLASELEREHFTTTAGWRMHASALRDLVVGGVRSRLIFFLGAVALVLLIACANVSNLLLARGAARARELAARAALGASPGRIVRALLVESLMLACGGAAMGVLIAAAAVKAFRQLAPAGMPRVADVKLDAPVLAFAAALAILTAVITGLVPALRAARVDLSQALREGGRAAPARRSRLGAALVTIELAMAVLLVAGAAALTRSFAAYSDWRPGFDRDHVLLFSLSPNGARYDSARKVAALWDQVEADLAAIPGVTAVGTASAGPLFGGRETWEMELQGLPPDEKATIRWSDVSPGYFRALGVPLRKGRDLDPHDVRGAPLVCLVNETLARRYWPGLDPIGRTIVMPIGTERTTYTVVGVVGDVPPVTPGAPVEPAMYWSNRQEPRIYTWVLLRTAADPLAILPVVRERMTALDRDMTIGTPTTMAAAMRTELNGPRFTMLLLQGFGVVALTLAAVGTYGLLAYLVTQRRREIGIRLALGAQRRQVVSMVLRYGLQLAAIGIVIGLIAFQVLGRVVGALAPGVSVRDPLSIVAPVSVLVSVAALACLVPAVRAGRIDPAGTVSAE